MTQPPQCIGCGHHIRSQILGWDYCRRAPVDDRWLTCAAARMPGRPCGPEGRLFWPALQQRNETSISC